MRIIKNDIVLISIFIIVSIVSFVVVFASASFGSRVIVSINGTTMYELDLSEDIEIDIDSEYGHNKLVIEDGECFLSDADCPDGLCIKQGKISKNGQSIICLPNKLVLTIKGEDETEIDTIAR
ncbi:MAG: NusG domain II-containing protein [Butyrivibrio sp.]|nr:NusG domain II-containing protein [Butyrivibrio sp.]